MIVSSSDVSIAMRRSLDGPEAEFLALILPQIHADVERFIDHAIEIEQRTETGISLAPFDTYVPLKFSPVRSVTSVTVNGVTPDSSFYTWDRCGLMLLTIDPLQTFPLFHPSSVDVTYTGGLGEPEATRMRTPVLMRAIRLMSKFRDDALGTDNISAERYVVKYLAEGFTDDEEAMLKPFRNMSMGTPPRSESFDWSTSNDPSTWGAWS